MCVRGARERASEKIGRGKKIVVAGMAKWMGFSVCVQREQHQRASGAAVAEAVAATATDAGVWHCAHFSVAAMGR